MSVSGIGSALSSLNPLQAQGRYSPTQTASSRTPALDQASAPKFSRRGQFMQKLQELAKSDPEQAKKMLGDLATKMRSEAQQGGAGSDRRMAIADRLQQAADSGDFSMLEEPGQRSPGGSTATQAYSQTMAMTRSSR